ncbi:TatD family hydrolase [Aliikangiella sp. IMCC44632]
MQLIDIGINLTNSRFDIDRATLIAEAKAKGVAKMVVTGTNLFESEQAINLAKQYPQELFATAGCHPHDAKDFTTDSLQQLRQLAKATEVVAIGECGLDFNRNFSPKDSQIKVFEAQLEIAIETQKPVFLHERDAFATQYSILKQVANAVNGAVVHCFTGTQKELSAYLDLGFSIGITGWLCDERRGKPLYDIVRYIPDDKLMIETDAPYLIPRNLKPKPKRSRNLPQYLPHIAQTVADARSQTVEHIAEITFANSCRFFGISPNES